ncbi:MAG: GGDEF domain-containing protein [Clostridiales bacterium]|nr:GGDEF domain-containing protein [Clostridiales bacterium]
MFDTIGNLFEVGEVFWLALFGVVFVIALIYLVRGIYVYSKRAVESSFFIALGIPIAVWAALVAAGSLFGIDNEQGSWAYLGIFATNLLIPVLLLLHVHSQTSYKPITAKYCLCWLLAPFALIAIEALETFELVYGFSTFAIYHDQIALISLISILYLIVVFVKSYLLCFNVFYQLPKHMRRSTYQLIIAITAIVVAESICMAVSSSQNVHDVLVAIAYIIAMNVLFSGFFIANTANVIATSRDFIFSSLSTTVFTVSLKGSILDWNHKEKDGCQPLPDPLYKEPYIRYRERVLETMGGTVSPHDENIICVRGEKGGGEHHFLFTWHDISYQGKVFGYLVEIAEIADTYSRLRQLEAIARCDSLTGLHNRNAYIERTRQLAKAENMPLLVMVGDVNNLKKVNDLQGHLLGDKLLKTVAKVVQEKAPARGFTARIGGDEFVLLLQNADERDAVTFITGVTEALDRVDDPELGKPSVSWGYAFMYNMAEDYNSVFLAADAIMYEAKCRMHEATISGVVPEKAEEVATADAAPDAVSAGADAGADGSDPVFYEVLGKDGETIW